MLPVPGGWGVADASGVLWDAGLGPDVGTVGEATDWPLTPSSPGGATAADHPLVVAARAARVAAGLPAATEVASSTDANAALGRGIPAISVSLAHGANAHRLDERVDLGSLPAGLASVEALVDALARGLSPA